MARLVEGLFNRMPDDTGRVLLDLRRCLEGFTHEAAQVIGIVSYAALAMA